MPITLIADAEYASFYEGEDAVYVNAHNQAAAVGTIGPNVITGQLVNGIPTNFIYRSGLFFDTSTIPAGAIISAATLSLYATAEIPAQNFDLTIVDGADLSNPRVDTDYGDLLDDIVSGGLLNTAGWAINIYQVITLNAAGIALITLAGITQLALRSSRDINSNPPAFGVGERIRALGIDATNPARLTVTYTADPTATTNPATEVA